MPGRATKAGITKAHRLRAEHGLGLGCPVPDLIALAERDCGVPVIIPEHLDDGLAGAYLPRAGKRPVIFLNGSDIAARMRFTLAHELGHHAFRDDRQADTHTGLVAPGHWIEVRANAFAAELLMPGPAVAVWGEGRTLSVEAVVDFANTFGTSLPASVIRFATAGLATAEEVAALRARIEADAALLYADCDYEDSIAAARRALPRWPHPGSPLAHGLPTGLARST